MQWARAGGILAHPTSFPGRFGIGDLGIEAERFFDFLTSSGQRYWQTLPLGPTGYGNSPYAALSAFAGNPAVISLERLVEDQLLPESALETIPDFPTDRVEFGAVVPWKMGMLREACNRFEDHASATLRAEYANFVNENTAWLNDFALFMALKDANGQRAWVEWPARYAQRKPQALAEARRDLAADIALHTFAQFIFFRQWGRLREQAHTRGLQIIGDLAIFVAHDSCDVWSHPELFKLDEHGQPTSVAGVPPDYFSETGQRWGNPLYRWDVLAESGYSWWVERVRQALHIYDVIRLDHFRGFEAYWEVPASEATAIQGSWQPGPGIGLFAAIREKLGDVPFIAEDLGVITPGVRALQEALGFPGMRVLQFAFGGSPQNRDLPHNYIPDAVVYTGTHDNDTTHGWFAASEGHERAYALDYLLCEPEGVVQAMIRAAYSSVAALALVPLQDVFDLDTEARMNFPSRADGNWEWRFTDAALTPERAAQLKLLATVFGRYEAASA
ncbi:MAG TPA: 4-alpha-glucanotransferase [Ktedonobacterales bacterium]